MNTIKLLSATGVTTSQLATLYNVSVECINKITGN